MTPGEISVLADLTRRRSGVVIDADKTYIIETRLAPIARRQGFISLSELALSYSIPDGLIRSTGFRGASLRLSGRNLYLWTKFPGVDPRLAWQGNVPVGGSSDFDSPPVPRVFLITVRASR